MKEKLKFENGLMYKFNGLNEQDRKSVLTFLNKQSNATQTLHFLILNHIRNYGNGDLTINVQTSMLQNKVMPAEEVVQPTINSNVDSITEIKQPITAPVETRQTPIEANEAQSTEVNESKKRKINKNAF